MTKNPTALTAIRLLRLVIKALHQTPEEGDQSQYPDQIMVMELPGTEYCSLSVMQEHRHKRDCGRYVFKARIVFDIKKGNLNEYNNIDKKA